MLPPGTSAASRPVPGQIYPHMYICTFHLYHNKPLYRQYVTKNRTATHMWTFAASPSSPPPSSSSAAVYLDPEVVIIRERLTEFTTTMTAVTSLAHVSTTEATSLVALGAVYVGTEKSLGVSTSTTSITWRRAQSPWPSSDTVPESDLSSASRSCSSTIFSRSPEWTSLLSGHPEDEVLAPGTWIRIHPHPKRFPTAHQPDWNTSRLLYRAHGLVVVNKPAGLPSQVSRFFPHFSGTPHSSPFQPLFSFLPFPFFVPAPRIKRRRVSCPSRRPGPRDPSPPPFAPPRPVDERCHRVRGGRGRVHLLPRGHGTSRSHQGIPGSHLRARRGGYRSHHPRQN